MGLHLLPDCQHLDHGYNLGVGECRRAASSTFVDFQQLVDSIEPVRHVSGITSEWFGLVLLPFVAFSADGAVAAGYYLQKALSRVRSKTDVPEPITTLAKAEAIDLSIQFVLLWMPFLTLLGWWTNKPFNLLFGALLTSMRLLPAKLKCPSDFFEVALLLGACFLVNFVTADSKTNWAEGFILLSFYAMMVSFSLLKVAEV